jgi:tetratricopeptide (TPR) repeat protein
MKMGRLAEAAAVVEARLAEAPDDVQARFLKGLVASARGDHRLAITTFRSILIDRPGATRVRLELARSFFLAKDYSNAVRQFQFALAGDVPPPVAANIQKYIAAIREAKTLNYSFGIALAPDSNLNTGSSAREVSLFGLPFDLSEEARQRSGIGLAIDAGGEWAPHVAPGLRMRVGLNAQRREYSGSDFDDTILSAYAGPRLVTGKWDLSLLGTGYKRWFGSSPYNQAAGARLEATYHVSGRIGVSGALSSHWVRHRAETARNGRIVALNAAGFYALTPTSSGIVKAGVSRQTARADAYSNWSAFAAVGYFRDLPAGFSVYAEPSFSVARYDEALLGFGETRRDNSRSVLVSVLNRRVVLQRFTPRISYTYTRQSSSIPLYEFTRNRWEVGLTTAF